MKKTIITLSICIFSVFLCIPNSNANELNSNSYYDGNNLNSKILEKKDNYTVVQSKKTGEIKVLYIKKDLNLINQMKSKYPNSSFEQIEDKSSRLGNEYKPMAPFMPGLSRYDEFFKGGLGGKAGEAFGKYIFDWFLFWRTKPEKYRYTEEARIGLDKVFEMFGHYLRWNGWHESNGYWAFIDGNKICVEWHYDSNYEGWYFLNPNGIMMDGSHGTGWIKHNYKWYEFEYGGKLIEHSGWEKYGEKWMYFEPGDFGGVTGSKEIDGYMYHFDDNGFLR